MKWTLRLAALLVLTAGVVGFAQETPPPASIVNDEGGPVRVEGIVTYTNLFFTAGVAQPIVLLEDQAGFVRRDKQFNFPLASQVLGNITSDFYTSPFTYSISLPIAPAGTLVDVDNDATEDVGVMVYTPAYWTNIFGDPFLEKRDGVGWSGAYAGTLVNDESEVEGGQYVVYAPEADQGFPSGFGEDGLLFTADDPIVTLPQGWTTVNMNTATFTFDRSATVAIDLLEPESGVLNDYSALSYPEAFDALVELLRTEYAFTEYKNIDWDALHAEFRPLMEEADANADSLAYKRALRAFAWRIPDGHVSVGGAGAQELSSDFVTATEGGLGMNIVELDDGRVIVSYVLEESPAASARIQPGDEIIAFNGVPITTVLENTVVYAAPFSVPSNLRIQQLRYAVRYPLGTTVDVVYRNSATSELNSASLEVIAERTTWSRTSILAGAPTFTGPVDYRLLPDGYAYVAITTFLQNEVLTIQDWEYFLTLVKDNEIPGIVIDMRYNGGGNGRLAAQMSGYFYDEETIVGYRSSYNREVGEFTLDEDEPVIVYPAPEVFRFSGPVAVLVGPVCASACDSFAYNMSLLDNVAIVGQYPSAGLGGSIDDTLMPGDINFRSTFSRSLDTNFEIHIEGKGVAPTLRVPINEETVFAEGDVVLQAAVDYLTAALSAPFSDGNALGTNDTASGTLTAGERVRHTITGPAEAVTVTVELEDASAQVVLRIYALDGTELGAVQQGELPDLPLLASVAGETLIIEIGTANDDVTSNYTITTTTP
ncbi:MAG: S41 family peptidase [Phototrophicaceae bacterium]|jgi:C-terminal processing protease CtpA/Prc